MRGRPQSLGLPMRGHFVYMCIIVTENGWIYVKTGQIESCTFAHTLYRPIQSNINLKTSAQSAQSKLQDDCKTCRESCSVCGTVQIKHRTSGI